ncbi:hypothetical protein KSS87_014932 [Heliosperma pusillum]|nr:hypothetical protein KSS87_010886 [Heliosperma pusillum]KAH9626180.1 hypothetical protein KSS87_014932 [Heliosperma pusillum]
MCCRNKQPSRSPQSDLGQKLISQTTKSLWGERLGLKT